MTQAELTKEKIINMIRDKAGYGIELLKTCEDYDITISDFYDFLYDIGYDYYGIPNTLKTNTTYYGFVTGDHIATGKHYNHSTPRTDTVNHPDYYKTGGVEAIDVIHAWNLGFDLGNAVKYISRAGKKDSSKYVEDLEKAEWYIRSEIERYKKDHGKT